MTKTIRIVCNEEVPVPSLFDKDNWEVLTCEDKDTVVLIRKQPPSLKGLIKLN